MVEQVSGYIYLASATGFSQTKGVYLVKSAVKAGHNIKTTSNSASVEYGSV